MKPRFKASSPYPPAKHLCTLCRSECQSNAEGSLILVRITLLSALLAIVTYLLVLASPALLAPIQLISLAGDIKGGGDIGYRIGFAGTLLLLVAQVYSLKIHRLGEGERTAAEWLKMHCYLSTAGGILILVHSGLPFSFTYADPFAHIYPGLGIRGLVGVQGLAAWLTLILLGSGLFGRYLYGRLRIGRLRIFRRWLFLHICLSGALYVSGVFHLVIAVSLRHISAA